MTLPLVDVRLALLWEQYGRSWRALAARLAATIPDADAAAARAARLAIVDDRALRRRCRRATADEREDAVRWLVGMRPRPAAAAPDEAVRAATTAALLARLGTGFPVMPRAEMEELIRRGVAVVRDVVRLLARARLDSAGRVLLWPVVVAGEIGDAAAIDVLARLLRHRSSEIAAAAAEALGRIGAPARPALEQATAARGDGRAVYAYGGLAMIHTDEVRGFLRERFVAAPEHGDLVAGALARHARREARTALREERRDAPGSMRAAFTSAIAGLSDGGDGGADALMADWRVRYRRLPSLGWAVPPSWIQVAALVRDRRRRAALGTPAPLGARRDLDGDARCRSCGGRMWQPVGLGVCGHTAPALLELQSALVRRWRVDGVPDVWAALDACDAADVLRGGTPRRGSSAETAGDVVAIARATLYWLANARLERMAAASRYLDLVVRDVGNLYGRHRCERWRRGEEADGRAPSWFSSAPCVSRPQMFS